MESFSLMLWKKGKKRDTKVDWIALKDDAKKVRKLLERHPSLVTDKDYYNIMPLHHAAFHGWLNVAKCLIDYGADVNAVDRWRNTPLAWAIEAHSADKDERYKSRKTRDDVITLLQSHGGLVNISKE